MDPKIIYVVLSVVISCGVGAWVGSWRGRPGAGIVLGLFGPIGWIVVAASPSAQPSTSDPIAPPSTLPLPPTPTTSAPTSVVAIAMALTVPIAAIIGFAVFHENSAAEAKAEADVMTALGVRMMEIPGATVIAVVNETETYLSAQVECANGQTFIHRVPRSRSDAQGTPFQIYQECNLADLRARAAAVK